MQESNVGPDDGFISRGGPAKQCRGSAPTCSLREQLGIHQGQASISRSPCAVNVATSTSGESGLRWSPRYRVDWEHMHRPRGGAAAWSGLQESACAGLEVAGCIYRLSWGHCKRALVLGRFLLDPPGPHSGDSDISSAW